MLALAPTPTAPPVWNDWGQQLQQKVQQGQQVTDTLDAACGTDPGVLCSVTFNITHDGSASRFVRDFLATPLSVLGSILFIIVIAWFVRRLTHKMIDRMVLHAAESTMPEKLRKRPTSGHAGSPVLLNERRRQRAHTTGSVLRSIATVVVFGIAILMVLDNLGMNLAPLLASAGIAGVAVGFGAQNLVKDFLSGVFMVLEDQYGVGDTIDVGEATGMVEAVTLRTTRLRDSEGVVWYVRNGTIQRVGNQSQGWARATVDIPVGYTTDVAALTTRLRRMAVAMWHEPAWAEVIAEEPEVWGLQSISTDTLVLRMSTKTAPLQQDGVARELRHRAKLVLDDMEPVEVEPTGAEPAKAGPAIAGPAVAEPAEAGPAEAGPTAKKTAATEPTTTEPTLTNLD